MSWTRVDWPDMETESQIHDMWGSDGELFFTTGRQLVRWDGESFETIGMWLGTGLSINAIWGNSTDEVFLAVGESDVVTSDCGPVYLMWWDGSEFHWF